MLRNKLWQAPPWLYSSTCLLYAARGQPQSSQVLKHSFQSVRLLKSKPKLDPNIISRRRSRKSAKKATVQKGTVEKQVVRKLTANKGGPLILRKIPGEGKGKGQPIDASETEPIVTGIGDGDHNVEVDKIAEPVLVGEENGTKAERRKGKRKDKGAPKTLKEALLDSKKKKKREKPEKREKLDISILHSRDLKFEPIDVTIPPVPMLSYGLDRVLFNPGVYLLQDPRSRVYNFDPYLEKIMPVNEFDFDALSEYKTSSKDEELLKLTKEVGTLFTGSTSSMSSILQHFHYLLSNFRGLNHSMLSREYPDPSAKFSKITLAPSAVFLRFKNGIYAIDADKSYDTPNIMSWLGHSLEKLLTVDRTEFERYRRSSSEKAPNEDSSSRCYHYSKQGNILMRSQLDAVDPRLPGTGVFDLKTRAVVSIRMDAQQYEVGSGYQIRKARGEWESFEREFYDMTRATLLKYSLQVRMGRMDGIFVAFHNIERIFGFQYLPLPDMDAVLHGQHDTILGNEEFKLSIALLDELLGRAIAQYPNTSLRLHIETRELRKTFMYVFVEPVTEERADQIQSAGAAAQTEFARTVVGAGKDDPEVQAAWQELQDEIDEQVDEDEYGEPQAENQSRLTDQEENEETLVEAELEAALVEQEEAENVHEKHEDDANDQEIKVRVENGVENNAEDEDIAGDPIDVEITDSGNAIPEINDHVDDLSKDLDSLYMTATAEDVVEVIHDDQESAANIIELQTTTAGEIKPASAQASRGPLMGWTLTLRNKINGEYVDRPEKYTEQDDWELEYHIQDIPEDTRWKLYDELVKRRRQVLDRDDTRNERLKLYRDFIHGYSRRGREWRREQDEMDEAKPVQLYKPLGPGSGTQILPGDEVKGETPAPPPSRDS